jgi:MinD superfamily P-loop ATPase
MFVPEKHDLALMKIVRGDEHDIETIAEIARKVGLDYDILVNRFLEEMGQAIGRPEELKLKLLVAIERVFGSEKAGEAAEKLNM